MIADYNINYKFWNHLIPGPLKSPAFLLHNKFKFPKKDLHHLLDKRIDYLIWPFPHDFHLKVVERNKARFFDKFVKRSIEEILMPYAMTELNEAPNAEGIRHAFVFIDFMNPKQVFNLMREINQAEKVLFDN